MADTSLARPGGRFVAGQSGNPAGRPKGSRNEILRLQQELEDIVRRHVDPTKICAVIDALIGRAIQGNVKAGDVVLSYVITKPAPIMDEDTDTGRTVVFKIENATFAATQGAESARRAAPITIEATPIEESSDNGEK